jgi:alpha/beta superfamily hydrolase
VEHLQRQGAQVSRQALTGYEALMAPPYQSVLPVGAVQATVDWVQALVRTQSTASAAGWAPLATLPASTSLHWPGPSGLPVHERVCEVDPAIGLNGILTWPGHADQPAPQRAVLLLPAGADRHIGPGRAYVGLARQLAAQGMAVLRLDISGVGDSPARPGCQENAVYTPQALQDVAAAVHHLHHALGIPHVSLIGYCSGSYNAFKAAVAQVPVQALVLVNPLVFFWKPGMSLASDTSEALVAYAARNYRRQIWRVSRWWGLLREPRKVFYAAQVMWRRPASLLMHSLRDLARHLGLPLKDDLGRELKLLTQRGVALRFVFATGDPGEALLRATGGRTVGRLEKAGALHIAHIEGADHDFTQRQHRLTLVQMLANTLGELHAGPGAKVSASTATCTPAEPAARPGSSWASDSA